MFGDMAVSLLFLGLCLLVLFLGPILNPLVSGRPRLMDFLDGFVLTAVLTLVIFHILPHAIEAQGPMVLLTAFAGMILPTLIERLGHTFANASHKTSLALAILGLALHMFADGVALIQPDTVHAAESNGVVPFAIFLHSIPMGLLIWWIIRPATDRKTALAILSLLGLALILGFGFGLTVLKASHPTSLGWFEGLVTGSLLHVMFHRLSPHGHAPESSGWQWASGVGCLVAIGLALIINPIVPILSHLEAWSGVGQTFYGLALISAPGLLLAYVAGGIIQIFLPKNSLGWLQRGNALTQAFKGMVFGLPIAVCSCGVIPLYKSLVKRGTPLAAAIAFLIATPELGFDALLISLPLLGSGLMIIRLVAAVIVALSVGCLIGLLFPQTPPKPEVADSTDPQYSFAKKLELSFKSAFGEIVDHTGPWIFVGLLIASFAEPLLHNTPIAGLSSYWQVPLFAILGMPVYVCASGSTPFVAALLAAGVSPGAGLAFLITGPATNLTAYGILSRLHNKKVALAFMALMFVIPVLLGYMVNAFFPSLAIPGVFAPDHAHGSVLQKICLAALGVVFVSLIIRKGPRHIINQIVSFEDETPHTHEHKNAKQTSSTPAKADKGSCCH